VEVYTTENEQVDALRRFFADNGKALAVGVVIGIAALVGWRYWSSHQATNSLEASTAYQQAAEALAAKKDGAVASIESLAQSNKNSYGVLAALDLAHYYVDQKDYAKAEQQLKLALSQTKDENLLPVINLRLAQVELQLKQPDEALKALDGVTAAGWTALAQELRGDVLVSKGDNGAARDAYSKSIAAATSQAQQSLLRMKLNNLSN